MTGAAIQELASGRAGPGDPEAWMALRKAVDLETLARHWLQVQAGLLGQARAGVLVLGQAEHGPFVPVAIWPNDHAITTELSLGAETALGERKGVLREGNSGLIVAFPVVLDEKLHGVAAFELSPRSRQDGAAAARQLQWGLAWIDAAIRRRSLLPNSSLVAAMDLVAVLLEAPTFESGLRAFAAEIGAVVGARWAAVGLARNGVVERPDALTLGASPERNAEFVQAIGAAMQESFDQRAHVCEPPLDDRKGLVTRAHRSLGNLSQSAAVCSVLIHRDGVAFGVITLAEGSDRSLDAEAFAYLRLVATLVGPAIELRRRDDRWIGAKLMESASDGIGALIGPGRLGLKIAALLLAVAAAVLPFVSWPYRISAPATLEGSIQRVLTAPIQGYIATAPVRAGDTVSAGDLVARLDDHDLKAERARWAAEREKAAREHQRALAEGDRTKVQIQRAQLDQAQARLDLIDEQLARIEVRAPFEGVIVRGDLSQALGAPVQRGDVLFELAPKGGYRVSLKVDERDIAELTPGQSGGLTLSSFPEMSFRIRIERLTPVAFVDEGRNNFRVEAALLDEAPALRPGMQGVAKVEIAARPLLEIMTLRLRHWLSLTWWRWRP